MTILCIDDEQGNIDRVVSSCSEMYPGDDVRGYHTDRETLKNILSQLEDNDADAGPHVEVRTFGSFDVYVDGALVSFRRSRAKEVLAYLVDKNGNSVSRRELFLALWEDGDYDRSNQKLLDNIIRSMRDTLAEYGISEICELSKGNLKIFPERIDCDFYRFLEGDVYAINSFRGEYMSAYCWANMTESFLANK